MVKKLRVQFIGAQLSMTILMQWYLILRMGKKVIIIKTIYIMLEL